MTPRTGRRSVANIVLYDGKDRFLLQLRTLDARLMPGYWAFFGGGVKRGESPLQAVLREAVEELSFLPSEAEKAAEKDITLFGEKVRMHVFIQRYRGAKTALRLGEGADWGWFTLEETAGLRMCARDRKMLKLLRSRIDKNARL